MRGGLLSKAKRGELATPLPFGFAYDDERQVVLDPDQQIQHLSVGAREYQLWNARKSTGALLCDFLGGLLPYPVLMGARARSLNSYSFDFIK
jgi:hypothetical protein